MATCLLKAVYKKYKAKMSTDDQVMDPVHPPLLSTLSSNHPACLSEVTPKEFKMTILTHVHKVK